MSGYTRRVDGHFSRTSHFQSTKKNEPVGRYSKQHRAPVDLGSKFEHTAGMNDQKIRTEFARDRLLERLAKRRAAAQRAADFDRQLARLMQQT
jgi:hypothetical protein